MKDQLKKYWFIVTIAVISVAFLALFIFASVKDKLPSKKVSGKDVVAIFNNQNIFADDIYETSKKTNGGKIFSTLILDALVNQEIQTTDEIKKEIDEREKSIIERFKEKNPQSYEEEIGNALKELGFVNGFRDLKAYVTGDVKTKKVMENFIQKNKDKYLKAIDEKKGRLVSHILVRYPQLTSSEKEGKKPEEIAKLQEERNVASEKALDEKKAQIDKELASKDFKEVAATYSDDEASKVVNGSLGYVNQETAFVKEFLDKALALKEGEVSDWVKTTYGYHKIKVDATGVDKLLANTETKSQIFNTILQQHPDIFKLTLKELLEKFPVETEDKEVQKVVKSLLQ